MRSWLFVLLFVVLSASIANAETYRKVCNGSTCRMVLVESAPTPADVQSKPVEVVVVKAPVRSVMANPVQRTVGVVQRVNQARPRLLGRVFGVCKCGCGK